MRTLLILPAFLIASMAFSQVYFVKFPNDTLLERCVVNAGTLTPNAPQWYNPDNLPLVAKYEDEIFGVCPVACFCVTRTWRVYNAATYDSTQVCRQIPRPFPHSFSIPAIGPVISPISAPGDPWSATAALIHPADTVFTNFSIYWDSTANCYTYVQRVNVLDQDKPVADNCPADPLVFSDTTENDPDFWNDPAWLDPLTGVTDLVECPLECTMLAYDSCSGPQVNIQYRLFLDLDQDDTLETVVTETSGQQRGVVYFGNALLPNFIGGIPRPFDARPVSENQKYRFDVESQIVGNRRVARVRWSSGVFPEPVNYVTPQLPPGNHKIRWSITDACGQDTVCEYPIKVDRLSPTQIPVDLTQAIKCHPNPFRDKTQVRFSLPEETAIVWRLYTATGILISQNRQIYSAGAHTLDISGKQLGSTGLYFLSVETKWRRTVQKLYFE